MIEHIEDLAFEKTHVDSRRGTQGSMYLTCPGSKKRKEDMMFFRKSGLLMIFLCFLMGFVSSARAAESDNSEKRILFEKLMLITDMQGRHYQMIDAMAKQVRMLLETSIRQTVKNVENATPEQKTRFAQIKESATKRLMIRMTDTMRQELSFTDFVDQVYYPFYDKHFSISELESIIRFYESPAGQKFVSTAPLLSQETAAIFNKLYAQKLQKMGQTIVEEELKRIAPELEKLGKN
jgi:hypothetical protein